MRTKSLLAAAAIVAAGIASSMAQSNVYSLNVVGYVNRVFHEGQFEMVSNPLNNGTNYLNNLIPTAPDGTTVFLWSFVDQNLDVTAPTYVNGPGWTPNVPIANGSGFFVVAPGPGDFTNTFVGEVRQGVQSVAVPGDGAFNAVGSLPAVGGTLNTILSGFGAVDGDTVFPWAPAPGGGDLDVTTSTFLSGPGWSPNLNVNVADAFFLVRGDTGTINWNQNFTVQ